MPKFKQIDSLEKMSFDALLKFVTNYCDDLSANGSLHALRRGIFTIKKHICGCVPCYFLSDFCARFVDQFSSKDRPHSHYKPALEMIMDIEIPGLRFEGKIVAYLDPVDADRLVRLEELDLSNFPVDVPISLEYFKLNDLKTLIFPINCTDHDLKIVGRNCSKLQVLKIRKSNVTDEGLSALSLCSELRVVDIVDCPVSYNGINSLLSVHPKIEQFAHWDGTGPSKGCDILSHLDTSVCPSVARFVYEYHRDARTLDLSTIVKKFPNLSNLKIVSQSGEDLSTLRALNNLAELEIAFAYSIFYEEIEAAWNNLKSLLTFIGSNITGLKFSCWDSGFFWYDDDLKFIFDNCPNIEHLGFDQGGGPVVVPPFQKLKRLHPRIPIEFEQIEILDDPALEFGKLLNLETLSVENYGMNLQALESIMLDNNRFPNLSVIETNGLKLEDLEHLERTARSHNLDFKIINDPESNWYLEFRFGDNRDSDDDDE